MLKSSDYLESVVFTIDTSGKKQRRRRWRAVRSAPSTLRTYIETHRLAEESTSLNTLLVAQRRAAVRRVAGFSGRRRSTPGRGPEGRAWWNAAPARDPLQQHGPEESARAMGRGARSGLGSATPVLVEPLVGWSNQIRRILPEFTAVHDELFRFSIRALVPLPGRFQATDFRTFATTLDGPVEKLANLCREAAVVRRENILTSGGSECDPRWQGPP